MSGKAPQIYIEGKIRTRSWDDKDKNKRYATEIVADVMQLLGKRTEDHGTVTQQVPQADLQNGDKTQVDEPEINNDLPF